MNPPQTGDERICDDKLQLIIEHGEPKGIRDRAGYLCFFNRVNKYSGQEERYRNELAQRARLADFLLASLKGVAPQTGDSQS